MRPSTGTFLTSSGTCFLSHIQLRACSFQRGAIDKLKGKTGKQRLFVIIRDRAWETSISRSCTVGSSSPMPSFIGGRHLVRWQAPYQPGQPRAASQPSSEGRGAGTGPPCLSVQLQVRVQECVYIFSPLSCGSPFPMTGSRQLPAGLHDTASSLNPMEITADLRDTNTFLKYGYIFV